MTNALRGQFTIALPDGSEVECLLNMHALAIWCEETGHSITDLQRQLSEETVHALPALTWAGVRTYADLNESEPPLSEKRYRVLLGSADWEDIVVKMIPALNLEPPTKDTKKKTATQTTSP